MKIRTISLFKQATELYFRKLAQLYVHAKKPLVIAVAGSVGKTSTKLMLSHMISTERRVSCMDDSYNSGLGLYLSVFELKIPKNNLSVLSWANHALAPIPMFFKKGPEVLILEYGIDRPGEMDELLSFIVPDIAILTAVTPEHMEFLKTLDGVAKEETKILHAAREFAVANDTDIDSEYIKDMDIYRYGSQLSGNFITIKSRKLDSTKLDISINGICIKDIETPLLSEALLRQLCGSALVAKLVGITPKGIKEGIKQVHPAASRMRPLAGVNGSIIIDDSVNFSPDAGVSAIQTIKLLPAKKRVAILGNMHELGDFINEGYRKVASEFPGLDCLVLVGDLSQEYFLPLAESYGFRKNRNLFLFDNSIDAGNFVSKKIASDYMVILVKGPFGGHYLEEATRALLVNPADIKKVTRQSSFWQRKKMQHFGHKYTPHSL